MMQAKDYIKQLEAEVCSQSEEIRRLTNALYIAVRLKLAFQSKCEKMRQMIKVITGLTIK